MIKILNKRTMVILIILFLVAIAIKYKQNVVTNKRQQPIVSSVFEHKTHGKPVYVKKIARKDVDVIETFTVKQIGSTMFEGYVTKDVIKNLQGGQEAILEIDALEVPGILMQVKDQINVETGLYSVVIKVNQKIKKRDKFIVCHAYTGTIPDAINIDNEYAQYEEGLYYAWITKDNKAYRKTLEIASQNGYGLIIASGIKEGDVLIVAGQSKLSEGDKVKIVN